MKESATIMPVKNKSIYFGDINSFAVVVVGGFEAISPVPEGICPVRGGDESFAWVEG